MTPTNVSAISSRLPGAPDPLVAAFPDVDCGHAPLTQHIVVQLRTPKKMSAGGIVLPDEVRETEKWNTQTAKVVAVGPLAFKDRDTLKPWPEGPGFAVGDFVRVPLHGGDKWAVNIPGAQVDDHALFLCLRDTDVICKVTGDPLAIIAVV